MTVNEILTHPVIVNFCNNTGWSENLSTYLDEICLSLSVEIEMRYDKLIALDGLERLITEHSEEFIAGYIYDRTHNEIERIFQALTVQYNPKYNYYRTITENNTGEDNHIYGGSDSENAGGHDSTHSTDSLDVDTETLKDESLNSQNVYDDATENGLRPTDKQENQYQVHDDYEEVLDTRTDYGKSNTIRFGKTLKMQFGRNVNTSIEGNNGIYPFPDLIKKEYDLRMKHKLFETFIMIIVGSVSSGVWEVSDV